MKVAGLSLETPPTYCQYSSGSCDQSFATCPHRQGFFIYPSAPHHLAQTIRECAANLRSHSPSSNWATWEDLQISGHIVFCEICKAMRFSKLIIANITTLNFNVLFELGYALGLQKPILVVRDTSYVRDKALYQEIGIFDTLGYSDFANSQELLSIVMSHHNREPVVSTSPRINAQQPIYYVKSPVNSDGSLKLLTALKKSYFRFRTFDSQETPRLSLHDAVSQVHSSIGVVAHLVDPNRSGAEAHNARAAFVCGLAMALGKQVMMIQEGTFSQPIDYRDVVLPYDDASNVPYFIEKLVRSVAESMQQLPEVTPAANRGSLEQLDMGDIAAENEIEPLTTYFVKTPQFQQARQGHARLVIGRKGSGKTALFYGVRRNLGKRNLVLDLKPEGYQFTKLRETVLVHLSEGSQLHTLTAFWHYLLLLEVAHRLVSAEVMTAWKDPATLARFTELRQLYDQHAEGKGDFSERLMGLVNRLVSTFAPPEKRTLTSAEITKLVYREDISSLEKLIVRHSASYDAVWLLFDNIDKGFPTQGLSREDVLLIRCLLEATRKLERAFATSDVSFSSIVFLRRDVYDLLVDQTPDRGKESHVNLDWSDAELIKERNWLVDAVSVSTLSC